MKSLMTVFYFLLAGSVSWARPFPSSGYNINCSLHVYDVKEFVSCPYGPHCMVNRAEATALFATLSGSLDEHLSGVLSVKEVRGYREANGGPVSVETQDLIKLISTANLRLEIDYSKPSFSAHLSSDTDSQNFDLSLKTMSDMSKGNRGTGPLSDLVKLKSNDSEVGGIYGQLSCSPSRN